MDRVNVRHRRLNKQNEATFLFTTAPCENGGMKGLVKGFLSCFFFSNHGLYRMR